MSEPNREKIGNPSNVPARPNEAVVIPVWVGAVVVLGALLMATGAILALVRPAMLVSPHDEISSAVRTYAGYLTSRNLTIAIMLLAALVLRARRMLNSLVLLTALIQVFDAVLDGVEGRWPLVPGVAILGVLFLFSSARLCGYPFWRVEAWRQSDREPG